MTAIADSKLSTEEAEAFAERCREFLAEHAKPIQRREMESVKHFQQAAVDAGLAGLPYASEYGGAGLTMEHERIWRQVSAQFPP